MMWTRVWELLTNSWFGSDLFECLAIEDIMPVRNSRDREFLPLGEMIGSMTEQEAMMMYGAIRAGDKTVAPIDLANRVASRLDSVVDPEGGRITA